MSTTHTTHGTPDSPKQTMLVVRISPALKRAVESSAQAGGETTSDWVRRLLVLHTDTKGAQA